MIKCMPFIKVLFIHHSTGGNLLYEGNLRKLLYEKKPSIELWDHGYNLYKIPIISNLLSKRTFHTGLSDKDGRMTGKDFDITISNNSPKEYAEIFSRDQKDPTLSSILSFDVIIFKNCYPTSKIRTDAQLEEDKKYYSQIRGDLKKYSKKHFIFMTQPPLRAELTTKVQAARARQLANWLKSNLFSSTNIVVFDLFDLLADYEGTNQNMLKREYCRLIPIDSHPNIAANKTIAPLFADFISRLTKK